MQIVAAYVDRLRHGIEREQAIADQETVHRQIDYGIENRRLGFRCVLRLRNIGGAIGKHQEICLGTFYSQVGNVEDTAQAGKQAQVHLNSRNPHPGRGACRLFPMNHEVRRYRLESPRTERERTKFDSSAGSRLGCRDDFLSNVAAEPIRLHHDDRSDSNHEDHPDQNNRDTQNSCPAAHCEAPPVNAC